VINFSQKTKAIVLTGNGTNCEMEMAYGCKLGGFDQVDIVHISELMYGERKLNDYHFLNLPGGFLDGDDLGAAKANANRIKHAVIKGAGERLFDHFLRFIERGGLILGVCNGFQLMVKLGLLPGFDREYTTQWVTLTFNDSGKFEDRWVHLKINSKSHCVFTQGIEYLSLPVRHGEGKFMVKDEGVLKRLHTRSQVVMQYSIDDYREWTNAYPLNPNGSVDGIAGICDESGRLLGMMPHPEAYLHYTNHPQWSRTHPQGEEGMGVTIFRNAAHYVKKMLLS
jgi:phosphoribosylformylglycinamidine synthase